MFGSMQSGASAYAKVGLETGVTAASPHKLISMLFEGAIVAVGNAAGHLATNEIEAKGLAISKAIAIVENGLRASLNAEAGGSIADSLDALYQYMTRRLMEANLRKDAAILAEIEQLLRDLKQSWDMIGNSQQPAPVPAPAAHAAQPRPGPWDSLSPRASSVVKA